MRCIWKENDVLGVTYKARSKNRTLFLLVPKVFSLDYTDYEVIIKKALNTDHSQTKPNYSILL